MVALLRLIFTTIPGSCQLYPPLISRQVGASNFSKMRFRWVLTVLVERYSSAAIWSLVRPAASRRRNSFGGRAWQPILPIWQEWAVVAAFALVFTAASRYLLGKAERLAKQQGLHGT